MFLLSLNTFVADELNVMHQLGNLVPGLHVVTHLDASRPACALGLVMCSVTIYLFS